MKPRLGYLGFLVLVAAVVIAPLLSSSYRTFQLAFVGIYLIALLGLNILTGLTGQISLGHGAFMGVGAYTTTILVVDHGWNNLLTLPVAGIITGLAGLAFGLPATRFTGPYLALATFAIPLSFIGLLKRFPHFTGGTLGKQLPPVHSQFGFHTNPSVWIYWISWIVALVLFAVAWLSTRGRFGRALRSVRDSEIAATASGVSTAGVKTVAFGISAFYCGVAGGLFAIAVTYVNPDTFPIDLSILLLVGVVLGGAGSLGGMVFGALFVEFIRITWGPALLDLFSQIHHINTRAPGSSLVVYGVVLLLVLYVAPAGAAGLVRRLVTGKAAVAAWAKQNQAPAEEQA
ncbi:MAG TPA: branched-chain amino acid ABC transporter permease [Gaiellaceae bacterium]|jgi:branched-chain amino acid transport system permease protein|nr:branched-chain amino acid ABC transporter permease [Gaiellaceae bacterium]